MNSINEREIIDNNTKENRCSINKYIGYLKKSVFIILLSVGISSISEAKEPLKSGFYRIPINQNYKLLESKKIGNPGIHIIKGVNKANPFESKNCNYSYVEIDGKIYKLGAKHCESIYGVNKYAIRDYDLVLKEAGYKEYTGGFFNTSKDSLNKHIGNNLKVVGCIGNEENCFEINGVLISLYIDNTNGIFSGYMKVNSDIFNKIEKFYGVDGLSGSPVFDENGKVLGVMAGYIKESGTISISFLNK
ncbi:MAG: hypothetical protein PHN31_02485 [Candidatus Gracilibacteria bacterium]|nr:hypothetical protein [Candidatus Gracilibacteria bacterium]